MRRSLPTTRRAGIALALGAAAISGAAIYFNGFAVTHAPSAASFTTAKNLVAALIVTALMSTTTRGAVRPSLRKLGGRQWLGLAFIGVIGGGVAFALFFEGLARGNATQAAFLQKTLVVWVVLLAVPLLHERVGAPHLAAIGLLMAGQLLLTGDVTHGRPGTAAAMILGATLLWAVEVVIARQVLQALPPAVLGATRMTAGSAVLLGWLAATHHLGQLGALGAGWAWALLGGVILAGYVITWFAALQRAAAVDVTEVLVAGAFLTALLSARGAQLTLAAQLGGMALIAAGTAVVVRAALSRPTPALQAAAP